MLITPGCEISFECRQPTPMVLLISPHHSIAQNLIDDAVTCFGPRIDSHEYKDSFGNICTRILAPTGPLSITTRLLAIDSGEQDEVASKARETAVDSVTDDALIFLLGSRYCDTNKLSDTAWSLFGESATGWARVQAICDFVHEHIEFGYKHADATRCASETLSEGMGVCRDYAHLAIAFCRCLNIPARYCTGYLSDIGTPPPYDVMDFAAWIEVYFDHQWHVFDPRNNTPRIGRILVARGRDAADVAISTTFGDCSLSGFSVFTDEVKPEAGSSGPIKALSSAS